MRRNHILIKEGVMSCVAVGFFCIFFAIVHAQSNVNLEQQEVTYTESYVHTEQPLTYEAELVPTVAEDIIVYETELVPTATEDIIVLEPPATTSIPKQRQISESEKKKPVVNYPTKKRAPVLEKEIKETQPLQAPIKDTVKQVVPILVAQSISSENDFIETVSRHIEERTNAFRKKNNQSPLNLDGALTQNAHTYSSIMLKGNFLSHTDKNNCDLTCRFKADGYKAMAWGENLAKIEFTDTPTPNEVADFFMDGWEKSSGHRENLLSPEFEKQGIGIAIGTSGIYATVHFAK